MSTTTLYVECPGAGGYVERYADAAEAEVEARAVAASYSDAYVEVSTPDHDGYKAVTFRRFGGVQFAPDSNGICDGYVEGRTFNCHNCAAHFAA